MPDILKMIEKQKKTAKSAGSKGRSAIAKSTPAKTTAAKQTAKTAQTGVMDAVKKQAKTTVPVEKAKAPEAPSVIETVKQLAEPKPAVPAEPKPPAAPEPPRAPAAAPPAANPAQSAPSQPAAAAVPTAPAAPAAPAAHPAAQTPAPAASEPHGQTLPQAPAYSSPYAAQLAELYRQIAARAPFSYDPEDDAVYNQYKTLYDSLGLNAMKNAQGQAASLTGGYGSTYGAQLGQSEYNNYLNRLAAIVPELRSGALKEWQSEGDSLAQQLTSLQKAENEDYARWRDAVGDRTQAERDAADAQSAAYRNVVNLISSTGYIPPEEELQKAGMSAEEAQAWAQIYQQSAAASAAASGSGSSGSSGGSSRSGTGAGSASAGTSAAAASQNPVGQRYLELLEQLRRIQEQASQSGGYNTNNVSRTPR